MVAVRLVVVGAEDGAEQPAAAVSHLPQKCSLSTTPMPVRQHGNAPPIRKQEPADVDGIGPGMLTGAAGGTPGHAPTRVGAGVVDASDPGVQMAGGGRGDHVPFPEVESRRHRAGHPDRRRIANGRTLDRDRPVQQAEPALNTIGNRGHEQRRASDRPLTRPWVVAQSRKLQAGGEADWVAEIDWRKGRMLRRQSLDRDHTGDAEQRHQR